VARDGATVRRRPCSSPGKGQRFSRRISTAMRRSKPSESSTAKAESVRQSPPTCLVESWDRVNDVNLKSMFLICKHVLPHMERQGKGAIVNIASVSGIRWLGVPYISYAATKAAVIQFTRVIALQYARSGIRANTILPGMMNTPMVHAPEVIAAYGGSAEEMVRRRDEQCPMGRMGDAWDVAYAALFLASDEAKYVTGTELIVDGGLTVNCV